MNASQAAGGVRPWYREFWPWALMLPPLFAVAGGVTMIVLATRTPSALVVEDYARIEELTAARFERDRRAAQLGLSAQLSWPRESGRLELSLDAPQEFVRPAALVLRLKHATDPSKDRELRLVRYAAVYAAEADWEPGRYGIELVSEDASWRLSADVVRLSERISLRAQAAGG